jgi:hypothetical protein
VTRLQKCLTEQVAGWATLGHAAIMERFVLRNGRAYTPRLRIGRAGRPKQCYANAAKCALRGRGTYVEGFVMRPEIGWPIQHAWVSINGDDAMDPTLDAFNAEYFGVAFGHKVLCRELQRNGVYGMIDTGTGLNMRLMFEIDPELEGIVQAIRKGKSHETGTNEKAEQRGVAR